LRTLLLALSLVAATVVFLPAATALPPVSACTGVMDRPCAGLVCVNHPTLAFIENPTCVGRAG